MTPALMGSPPENGEAPEVFQHPEAPNQTTALPLSSFSPKSVKYPSLRFLPGRVLGILLTGRVLTHKDSWIELGHARLADSVWKLRALGWPVRMREVVVRTSDAGRPATIGEYYLPADAIAAAGEAGRDFAAECLRVERERRAA